MKVFLQVCFASGFMLVSLSGLPTASGEPMTIIGNVADAVARNTTESGTGSGQTVADQTKTTLRVGTFGGPTGTADFRNTPVFVFELPTLALGDYIGSAGFSVHYFSRNGAPLPYNMDVWALRVSGSATVLASDYGAGPNPEGPSGQMLLQEDFITSSSATGQRYSTNAAANTALTQFLNANYSSGGFLFIRANVDNSLDYGANGFGGTLDQGYELGSANLTAPADLQRRPELVITVVPEPSAIWFLMSAAGVWLVYAFRHRVHSHHSWTLATCMAAVAARSPVWKPSS